MGRYPGWWRLVAAGPISPLWCLARSAGPPGFWRRPGVVQPGAPTTDTEPVSWCHDPQQPTWAPFRFFRSTSLKPRNSREPSENTASEGLDPEDPSQGPAWSRSPSRFGRLARPNFVWEAQVMVMEGGPWSVPKYLVEALASETQQSQGRGYPMTIYIYIYIVHTWHEAACKEKSLKLEDSSENIQFPFQRLWSGPRLILDTRKACWLLAQAGWPMLILNQKTPLLVNNVEINVLYNMSKQTVKNLQKLS